LSLKEVTFKLQYRSDEDNLINDFYIPCMQESIRYDRAVGYFTSGILAEAAQGIEKFIKQDGKIRIIASPKLSDDDVSAIKQGIKAKEEAIEEALLRELNISEYIIQNNTLKAMAWLIYKGKLEIKIAVLKETKLGIYHEKFGMFTDEDENKVGFIGSSNETKGGYVKNFESFDVYLSSNERDLLRIQLKEKNFEKLWNNETDGLDVLNFPEAVKKKLFENLNEEESNDYLCATNESKEIKDLRDIRIPTHLKIREYQNEAIKSWLQNKGQGILEMATGTGKTITALYLIAKVYKKALKLAIVIVCPYQHLVTQWGKEAEQFGIESTLCYGGKNEWQPNLKEEINNFNMSISKYISIIVTNTTFCTNHFKEMIDLIKEPIIIVFDEAHHVGTENFMRFLPQHIDMRLGLSATPSRWYDDDGNKILEKYFGGIVYRFSLENAIGEFLTEYYYYPHLVYFTDEESEEYHSISSKIGKYFAFLNNENNNGDEDGILKQLLIKRSKLIGKAGNKIVKLKECLRGKEKSKYNLFYTGDGKTEGERQIEAVIKMLGTEIGMKVHPFTSAENREERESILKSYQTGELQGLVAIRCLDEGVNIPLIQTAYILASSTNPREFIQRRGRVLRKHPQKDFSYIHDFIVVPSDLEELKYRDDRTFNVERSLMKKELARVNEFCNTALNGPEAQQQLLEIKKAYNLLDM
jgi:DNA phosphorothioation system restriction enzyme